MSPRFEADERLDDAKERGVGVQMAIPLHERLDQLADIVHEAGFARPTKRKMLSAIVLGAPTDAKVLDRMLRAYDRARVSEALASEQPEGGVIEFPRRASGPRPKRTA